MKVLERSQKISHCKSMQFFYDTQGKLSSQSKVGSTLNSISSKFLWLSLLPARMKKMQSKMKALKWSTILHYPSIFKMFKDSLLLSR